MGKESYSMISFFLDLSVSVIYEFVYHRMQHVFLCYL